MRLRPLPLKSRLPLMPKPKPLLPKPKPLMPKRKPLMRLLPLPLLLPLRSLSHLCLSQP